MASPTFHPFTSAAKSLRVVPISGSTATVTVLSAIAGRKFFVYHVYVEVSVDATITFNASLSGAISVAAATPLEIKNAGFPVFVIPGGSGFTISNPGTATITGWALIEEVSA